MALLRDKPSNIPKDAVILNERDALEYQLKFLKNWKNQSDLWAFKHEGTILASLSAFTGFYINNHFRSRLKLLNYGKFANYIPVCIIPPILSYIFHNIFVVPDIVLQKNCAVCTEMRSSALQAFSGMIFPYALAPMASFSLAVRYNTYQVPHLTSEPLKVLLLIRKLTMPIGNKLFAIFLGHAITAAVLTGLAAGNINKVHQKLMLLDYEYDLNS